MGYGYQIVGRGAAKSLYDSSYIRDAVFRRIRISEIRRLHKIIFGSIDPILDKQLNELDDYYKEIIKNVAAMV